MIEVSDPASYLQTVVRDFRDWAALTTGFELRKKLWHSCIVVCEVTKTDYADWHLTLAKIAAEAGLKPGEVIATVRSARRKAGVQ